MDLATTEQTDEPQKPPPPKSLDDLQWIWEKTYVIQHGKDGYLARFVGAPRKGRILRADTPDDLHALISDDYPKHVS